MFGWRAAGVLVRAAKRSGPAGSSFSKFLQGDSSAVANRWVQVTDNNGGARFISAFPTFEEVAESKDWRSDSFILQLERVSPYTEEQLRQARENNAIFYRGLLVFYQLLEEKDLSANSSGEDPGIKLASGEVLYPGEQCVPPVQEVQNKYNPNTPRPALREPGPGFRWMSTFAALAIPGDFAGLVATVGARQLSISAESIAKMSDMQEITGLNLKVLSKLSGSRKEIFEKLSWWVDAVKSQARVETVESYVRHSGKFNEAVNVGNYLDADELRHVLLDSYFFLNVTDMPDMTMGLLAQTPGMFRALNVLFNNKDDDMWRDVEIAIDCLGYDPKAVIYILSRSVPGFSIVDESDEERDDDNFAPFPR